MTPFPKGDYRRHYRVMKLDDIKKGATEPGDCGNPMDKIPEWLDLEKFSRGQKFVQNHLFPVFVALHASLTSGFSIINLLVPLIYTKQSDTPEKSMKRYLATFEHVNSWFTDSDIWKPTSKGHKSIKTVRHMHNRVAGSMKKNVGDKVYISQYDMALVQSGFMAAVVMYPKEFGIRSTDAELEDFIHFWRGLGYLLGIDDKYNICQGNLCETYNICKQIEQEILIPSIHSPPEGFQLMADAYSNGWNIPFLVKTTTTSTLAFVFDGMGLELPEMEWEDWFIYQRTKWLITMIWYTPGFESFMNWSFSKKVQSLVSKYLHDA